MESERFHIDATLIECSAEPIVILDAEGTIQVLNSSAERALGWRRAEVQGGSLGAVCVLEQAKAQPAALLDWARQTPANRLSCEVRAGGGRSLWARFSLAALGRNEDRGVLLTLEALSSLGSVFEYQLGDDADYEISTCAKSFGQIRRVNTMGVATFHGADRTRCFELLQRRTSACPYCPLLRPENEPWPRVGATRRNDAEIRIITANTIGRATARVSVRIVSEAALQISRELKVTELSARASLSPSEHNVLLHLVQGEPNNAIADALGITESTVKFHLTNVLRKLGADSRVDLLRLLA